MVTRSDLHRIVDELQEGEVDRAARLLESLGDPLTILLDGAPEEDEEITDDEERLVEQGRHALLKGEALTTAELRRELGI